jgi:hypothetical protein
MPARFPAWQAQLEQVAKYDPQKVFEPNIWRQVVNNEPYTPYPGCALNKDCFCTADEHCARGYACVPSLSFPEFNVCKPDFKAYEAKAKDFSGWKGLWERYKAGGVGGTATTAEQMAAHSLLGFKP